MPNPTVAVCCEHLMASGSPDLSPPLPPFLPTFQNPYINPTDLNHGSQMAKNILAPELGRHVPSA